MTNIIDALIELLGTPPNEQVETLYYVFGLILILLFFRIGLSICKAVLGIKE